MKKKKKGFEQDLLHVREGLVGFEKLAKRCWTKENSRALLGVVREAALRAVKLIERALKRRKEKKDE